MHHAGMKYSLPSRELIADSIEIMATAHPVDGLILVANCDKIIPGMLMAALAPQHPRYPDFRRAYAGRAL